jgi:hypothetical protein
MDIRFPFTPKSNSKLLPGFFWPIKLSNGNYACGIILDVPEDKKLYGTKSIYVGLLDWTSKIKPTGQSLELNRLKLVGQGHVNIKTIINQGEAIEGYIDIEKNNLKIELNVSNSHYSPDSHILKGFNIIRHSTKEDHKKLKNKSTWGYSVIVNMANKLFVVNA